MGTIVCAIRGGEASRRTQEKAIAIAKEKKAKLIFLFVIDPDLMKKVDSHIAKEFIEELSFLARLHLRVACYRARKEDLEADFVIGENKIKEAIEYCLKEYKADLFIMGSPKKDHPQSQFVMEQLRQFADEISEATGVPVEIV